MEFLGTISTDKDLATKEYVDGRIIYLNGGVRTVGADPSIYPPEVGIKFFNYPTNNIWECVEIVGHGAQWNTSTPVAGVLYVDNSGRLDTFCHGGSYFYNGTTLVETGEALYDYNDNITAKTVHNAINELASKVAANTSAISSLGNISEYKVVRGTATTNAAGVATLDYSSAGFTEKPFIMAGGIFMTHLSSSFFKGITIQSDALYTTTSCGVFLLTGSAANSAIGANKTFDWIAIGK